MHRVPLAREAGHHTTLSVLRFVDVKQILPNANADAGRGRLCAVQLSSSSSPTGRGAGKRKHALVRDCRFGYQNNNHNVVLPPAVARQRAAVGDTPARWDFFPLLAPARGVQKTQ